MSCESLMYDVPRATSGHLLSVNSTSIRVFLLDLRSYPFNTP